MMLGKKKSSKTLACERVKTNMKKIRIIHKKVKVSQTLGEDGGI